MYKLIAIDIDDTLINDHKEVTPATQQALEDAVKAGVVVTLATGRAYASANKIARQTGLNVPIITYQGALVKNLLDEKVLYERYMPIDAARKLFQYCIEHDLHLQTYIDDKLYAREENQKLKDYAGLNNTQYHIEPDFEKLIAQPTPKMLIIDEPAYLDELIPVFKELLGDGVHITKSKPNFLEFMHKEGTKGAALTFLADHFGCDLSETIAIGDSWNDHEMLEVAGLGVAMGNAIQPLKELADYITASNNEDGVKQVIEEFVLKAK
ncbi:Cof subfamily protein (haloacid dehalogenase superfamily) [Paenibacillus shirakamiensis]|uniref:Cof subfamily protein (Haloacid dehalogenase superfamily) n=1 Tax=Paenibacillus shirakamiensis TaxID=1265935 RepID=A0ABS4JFQ3_9BACL|nr:Cof-type HAD-IIB family hydrolase [Paenibacillus shirakamiensis]MBP2000538.1 Cof subfamily protein (haloacid dehalogenase superfamily) [Paenibacillus shirakamiensis]